MFDLSFLPSPAQYCGNWTQYEAICWRAENPRLEIALADQASYQTEDEACSLKQNCKVQMGCKCLSVALVGR